MNLHTPCDASLASDEVRYRSAHPTDYTTSNLTTNFLCERTASGCCMQCWRRRSDSNGWCLLRHSALAVRCLKPLGHVSRTLWWGWRESNSHARRRWFLRPVCLPFPPHPHDLLTSSTLNTHQAIGSISTNPATNGGLPWTRTLKMTQLLRLPRLPIPPEARKNEKPLDFSRGFGDSVD